MKYFSIHNHTDMGSNVRLLDSIIKIDELVAYANELGLPGLAVTDHESLAQSIEVCNLQKKYPNMKLAIGNEIYLTETRERKQKYYHLILIAKNEMGHAQLRKLSSIAWYNSYFYGDQRRVPTLKSELSKIVKENPGNLICTTACRGSELGTEIWKLIQGDATAHERIVNLMLYLKDLFGDDLYVEMAPNKDDKEQIAINKRNAAVAKAFGLKTVVGTDSHYLKLEDKLAHQTFLNAKDGERETRDFYATTYMMSEEELYDQLSTSFDKEYIDYMCENTLEIMDKIEVYDLHKKQQVKQSNVVVPKYDKRIDEVKYPTLALLFDSKDKQEQFWVKTCLSKLEEIGKYNDAYLSRLEIEADVIKFVGEDFGTVLFAYFNNMAHYIDYIWDVGSIVGVSRGSACCYLSNYLLGIVQIDPIKEGLDCWWRFLNKGNVGSIITTDIDIDCDPLARNAFVNKMKKEVGEINCIAVGAYGTLTAKNAVGVSCRGYRSEEYPKGIDKDDREYLSNLIPQERGFIWPLHDVVYGNEEKDRKPINEFVREVEKYPGLLDIMFKLEGCVDKITRHAAGIVIAEDMLEHCSVMRTPSGELITCYSLTPAEEAGLVKIDVLVTDAASKITETIKSLQSHGEIPKEYSLRECYNKYIHPDVIDASDKRLWERINSNTVMDLFQFSTGVGLEAIKKIKPQNVVELANTNAALRLISEKGKETPVDRFVRMKNDISYWYKEMTQRGLTREQIKSLEPYYLPYSGCIFLQESLMLILMNICGFSLSEANQGRKIVAKKNMKQIPWLKDSIYSSIPDRNFADYIWDTAIAPQLSYAFSLPHCLGYGWIAMQEAYITLKWSPIYWATACLNINASTIDEVDFDEEYEVENGVAADNEEVTEQKKKALGTKYDKIARAIGDLKKDGVMISVPSINKAQKEFEPDPDSYRIYYALKALTDVGDKEIDAIISNRPYESFDDFLNKVNIKKPSVISLIKAGAFNSIENRSEVDIMEKYISIISEPKKRLTMQNLNGLIQAGLIPDAFAFEKRVFNFNKYLKLKCFDYKDSFLLDERAQEFLNNYYEDIYSYCELKGGKVFIKKDIWKKQYDRTMLVIKDFIVSNQENLLKNFNNILFNEVWNKYCSGNVSKWNMDSMSYYYYEHELKNVNTIKYGLSDFSRLSETPPVDRYFKKGGRDIPIFKLTRIVGTCIGKNNNKSTFTLLTPDGEVVDIKLTNEHYALYNKRITQSQPDGTKKVVDTSWFTKGTKLMVTGYRRGANFACKKYKNTETHRLYKIIEVKNNGDLELLSERQQGDGFDYEEIKKLRG